LNMMLDISDENVLLYGKHIGRFNDEKVLSFMKMAGRDTWSRGLRDYIDNVYVDYEVCPHCASNDFRRLREITESVIAGYCMNCKANLLDINGRVECFYSGKTGVLMSHSRLYYNSDK